MKFVFLATMTVLVLIPLLRSTAEAAASSSEDWTSRDSRGPSREWWSKSPTESRRVITSLNTSRRFSPFPSASKKFFVYPKTSDIASSRGEVASEEQTRFLRSSLVPTPHLMEISTMSEGPSSSPEHQIKLVQDQRRGRETNDSVAETRVVEERTDFSSVETSSKLTDLVLKAKRKEEAKEDDYVGKSIQDQDEARGGEDYGSPRGESFELKGTLQREIPNDSGNLSIVTSVNHYSTTLQPMTLSTPPSHSFPSVMSPYDDLKKQKAKTTSTKDTVESESSNFYDSGRDFTSNIISRSFKDNKLTNLFAEQKKVFFGEGRKMGANGEVSPLEAKNVIKPMEGADFDYEGENKEFLTFLIWGSSVKKNKPSMSLRKMVDGDPINTPWNTSLSPGRLLNSTHPSHQQSDLNGNNVNLIINRNNLANVLKYGKPVSSLRQQQMKQTGGDGSKTSMKSININVSLNHYPNGSVIVLNDGNRAGRSSGRSSAVRLDTEGSVRIPCYVVIFLLGMVGNTLVIVTLLQNRKMRTVTNVFLLNLAIADLLLGVFCMPFTLVGSLLRDFIFGDVMCRVIPYFQAVSVSVSVWTLVAISLERYYAICQPLRSRGWQTLSHAYKIITLVWLLSLAIMCPTAALSQLMPVGNTGRHKCREVWPSLILERLFALFLGVVLLLLPLVIMIAAYSSITASLWHVISLTDLNSLAVVQQSLRNSREAAPRRQPPKISIRFRKIPPTTRTNDICQTCQANQASQRLNSSSSNPHHHHKNKNYHHDSHHHHQKCCCHRSKWQLAPVKETEEDLGGEMGDGVGGIDGGTVEITGVELGLSGGCNSKNGVGEGEGERQKLDDAGGKKDSSQKNRLVCGRQDGTCFGRTHEATEGCRGIRTSCCCKCESTSCVTTPMSCNSSSFHGCDSPGAVGCCCYGGCGCCTSDNGDTGSGGGSGKSVNLDGCTCGKADKKFWDKKNCNRDGNRSPTFKRLRSTHLEKSIAAKKHVVRMLFVVVLLFFVCWTPIFIVNILYLFIPEKVYNSLGSFGISFLHLLSYFSSCCNPITYCFMNKKFLQGFKYAFGCCSGKKERLSKLNGTAASFRSNSQHAYRLALEVKKDLGEANL